MYPLRLSLPSLFLPLALLGCEAAPEFAEGDVHGRVYMTGPVRGGQLQVTQMLPSGERGSLLGEGPIGADGRFSLHARSATKSVLLEVFNAEGYDDLESGEFVPLEKGLQLSALIADFPTDHDRELAITPYSSLVAAYAEGRMKRGTSSGRYYSEALLALSHLEKHLVGIQLDEGLPVFPADGPGHFLAPARYGVMLGALSALSQRLARETSTDVEAAPHEILALWVDDISSDEALFDGVGASERGVGVEKRLEIACGNCANDECRRLCVFDANTLRHDLALAFRYYANKYGTDLNVSEGDIAAHVEDIALNEDPELFPEDVAPLRPAKPALEIHFDNPKTLANTATLPSEFTLVARASGGPNVRLRLLEPKNLGDRNHRSDTVEIAFEAADGRDREVFLFEAVAADGSTKTRALDVTIDRDMPTISAKTLFSNQPVLKLDVTAKDNHGASLKLIEDAGLGLVDTSPSADVFQADLHRSAVTGDRVTLVFQATDGAGKQFTKPLTFVFDSKTPEVKAVEVEDVVKAGDVLWTAKGTANLAGEIDDFAGSGVQIVEIQPRKGDTIQVQVVDGQFQASVPLFADGDCGTEDHESLNDVDIIATDLAGNRMTRKLNVRLDVCPPTAEAAHARITDERRFTASFDGDAVPCLLGEEKLSEDPPDLLQEDAIADVFKHAHHYSGHAADCGEGPAAPANALRFHVEVVDNHAVASVHYRVFSPDDTVTATAEATHVEKDTWEIVLSGDGEAGLAVPALTELDGRYEIEIIARDKSGVKGTMKKRLRFDNHRLAGPYRVAVESVNDEAFSAPAFFTNPTKTHPGLLAKPVGESPGIVIGVMRFENGTSRAGMVVVTPDITAQVSTAFQWKTESTTKKAPATHVPGCASSTNSHFAPATAQGKCIELPSKVPPFGPTARKNFVSKLVAWDPDKRETVAACAGPDCLENEFPIRAANDLGPGRLEVYLVTSPWTFLWNQDVARKNHPTGTPALHSLPTDKKKKYYGYSFEFGTLLVTEAENDAITVGDPELVVDGNGRATLPNGRRFNPQKKTVGIARMHVMLQKATVTVTDEPNTETGSKNTLTYDARLPKGTRSVREEDREIPFSTEIPLGGPQ